MANIVDLVESHKKKAQFHSDMATRGAAQLLDVVPQDAANICDGAWHSVE